MKTPELTKDYYLMAEWPAPAQIKAFITVRQAHINNPPFSGFNFSTSVGDDPDSVMVCRKKLAQDWRFTEPPQWPHQVHGNNVVRAEELVGMVQADVVWTAQMNTPCAILTADCLPIFFCRDDGARVGVVHAGWRGILANVIEATITCLGGRGDAWIIWLGPAISQRYFEVGSDVRDAFMHADPEAKSAFFPSLGDKDKFHADIYQLARLRLQHQGYVNIFGGDYCTFAQQEYFYSFRRDGKTGRMASVIWIE